MYTISYQGDVNRHPSHKSFDLTIAHLRKMKAIFKTKQQALAFFNECYLPITNVDDIIAMDYQHLKRNIAKQNKNQFIY